MTGTLETIASVVARILSEKGAPATDLKPGTVFLGDDLPFDSLDLATLLVELEEKTGKDPFRAGYRAFRTAGELAALYDGA